MGEVVVSSFEGMEMEKKESKEGSISMVKWENFLPKSGLRVLLVEADDSTRQIIGALLRKCSYKVATAPDGLKAWEVLKARPHNIDLILTEMELPSISGYALLTLIMEHEICKKIPVIMMSKYDTVSLVYKCMMRGAADFLVKPIRINELKNLWQHVWRRQSQVSGGVHDPQDQSVAQEKVEATAENNSPSDRSSGSKACSPRQEDCLKKGSDAQSSCGKLDLEGVSAYSAEVEDYSQPKEVPPVTELRVQARHNPSAPEGAAQDTAAYKGNRALDRDQWLEERRLAENVNLWVQPSDSKMVMTNSPRQAIDLIGAFANDSKHNSCLNDGANKYDSSPHLDLSLTRSPVATENKSGNENQRLIHSNASAFTLYVNRTIQASNSNATSGPIPNHNKVCSGEHLSDSNAPESNTSANKDSFLQYGRKVVSVPVNECVTVPQNLFQIPLQAGGIYVDGGSTHVGYGSTMPPTVCTPSPSPSPSSANKQMLIGQQRYSPLDHSPRISSSQPVYRPDQKMQSLEDQPHFPVTDRCASNGPEGGNEQANGLSQQRSLQREAALNKFRLKRKERCYDKKVRYESRKKLAEQRPRVKGQFVRQVPPDPPPPKSDRSGGIPVAI